MLPVFIDPKSRNGIWMKSPGLTFYCQRLPAVILQCKS